MDALIRAATLSREPRRLERRGAPAAVPAVQPPVEAPARPPEAPRLDVEAQRAQQRQAEQERLAARQRAEREGYEAGHAKGLADAQASYQERLQHLHALIQNAGQAFASQIDGLEDIAVGIAFEALAKLLGSALVTPAGAQAAVAQVLEHTRQSEKLTVRLAPGDFYLLLQQPSDHLALARPGIELMPDERVELGGCVVDTAAGSLDGRIETQLEALRGVLLNARRQRAGDGSGV